jgi:hypothetical protein
MKSEQWDTGISLIPETPEDKETLNRFWKGGISILSYGSTGKMALKFADTTEGEKKQEQAEPKIK